MSTPAERFEDLLRIKPGTSVDLGDHDPDDTHGHDKAGAAKIAAKHLDQLTDLQERIWAQRSEAVLIVLQGIDTSGKDGTIRHVMDAFNPQGCRVAGFGVPTPIELAHDHLWRIHAQTPELGDVTIFNRSHYESVLVVRVHELVPKERWEQYYGEINDFERLLTDAGTTVIKFFLHIDKDEQRARLQARYDDPTKQWKFQLGDLEERKRWDDYMAAYADALTRCSTENAPWYVIPSNHKWFRNLAVGAILVDRLAALKPQYPTPVLPPNLTIE
jgi:PPK2 family polyphosphate:nucleotide phosphotransferase